MKPLFRPVGLRCEFLTNPVGIGEPAPRLSWRMEDARPGARQTAWRIAAASTPEALDGKPDLWDTGRTAGSPCLDVEYAGKRLGSRRRVFWRVRVWDREGAPSPWSGTAFFETGLLRRTDWQAQWISHPAKPDPEGGPCPHFRSEFTLPAPPVRARLYVTARGVYEAVLNGVRVGQDLFNPGWTDYRKRIQVHAYDVTGMLRQGTNAVGAVLGDGWFLGALLRKDRLSYYGDRLSLLMQLEVSCADGSGILVKTGPGWKTATGPILASDFWHGETYDARLELGAWGKPGYGDADWQDAVAADPPKAALCAPIALPVRRQETLAPLSLASPKPGSWVYDLGQNMVGWARVTLREAAGTAVTLRFAEMRNPDGTLYLANLRSARATDTYVCRGAKSETWEPRFTFHGFRYAELSGLAGQPRLSDLEGVVLHSEMSRTGTFECSDPLVNRLQENVRWGQKGNFLDIPTDCPQRDERLGWTGDAQVFARTACGNRDVAAFFEEWCRDMADAQTREGAVPHVVPDIWNGGGAGAAAWADAAVTVPWTVYLCYGDRRILERSWQMMRRWVDWRAARSPGLVCPHAAFGDWLAIDIAEGDPGRSPTPRDLIATAYFAHTAGIAAKAARVLGKAEEAKRYGTLARRVTAAFRREFVSPAGRLAGDTQTAYLLALGFGLLPAARRAHAAERLLADLEARKWHLSTGFVGTPLLAPVLSSLGRTDAAYRLLLQRTYPSWLYTVDQGATTMWERWNSYTKEKGFGDASMNSFNHYAYGAIGEWLYSVVAGIDLDPEEPGYGHVIFRPQPGEGISWARGEIETRYGRTACRWERKGRRLQGEVTIPPNAHGTLILPGGRPRALEAGTHPFRAAWKP